MFIIFKELLKNSCNVCQIDRNAVRTTWSLNAMCTNKFECKNQKGLTPKPLLSNFISNALGFKVQIVELK